MLRGTLFSVGVEVCEGRCVCDGQLGLLLSCVVGWRVIVGVILNSSSSCPGATKKEVALVV